MGLWCALAIAAAGTLISLRSVEQWVIDTVEGVLGRGLGTTVSIARIGASAHPAVALHDLRVGRWLSVDRLEIELALRDLRALPRVAAVRLLRPVLVLDEHAVARLRRRASSSGDAAAGSPRALKRQLPRVEIHDGALRASAALGGRVVAVDAQGIHLDGARGRLIAGPVRLSLAGAPLVELAAAALDLPRRRLWPPRRGALLGGRLFAPGAAQATLGIPHATLRHSGDGYAVTLDGRGGGRDPGALSLRATVRADRQVAVDLTLEDVALASLGPSAERLGLRLDRTRVSGALTLSGSEAELTAQGKLTLRHFGVGHEWIAARPVESPELTLDGKLRWSDARRELAVERLAIAAAGVAVALRGAATLLPSGGARLAIDAQLPTTGCQQALAALPAGFAPALEGMALRGELGARAALRLDTDALAAARVQVDLRPQSCKVVADSPRAPVHKLWGRNVPAHVTGGGGQLEPWTVGPANPDYRPLSRIARSIRAAFVAGEDSNFYRHSGFDTVQLERAFVANLQAGRPVRGASTVSMQLAKNLFLSPRRTISRKLQEIVLTWRMEQVLSKERILELYLNLVEMGPGIRGVEQACRHYFGHGAEHATPLEAAHLAALAPSPRPLAARFAKDAPGPAWRAKLQQLLRIMRRNGSISGAQLARWSKAPLNLARRSGDWVGE